MSDLNFEELDKKIKDHLDDPSPALDSRSSTAGSTDVTSTKDQPRKDQGVPIKVSVNRDSARQQPASVSGNTPERQQRIFVGTRAQDVELSRKITKDYQEKQEDKLEKDATEATSNEGVIAEPVDDYKEAFDNDIEQSSLMEEDHKELSSSDSNEMDELSLDELDSVDSNRIVEDSALVKKQDLIGEKDKEVEIPESATMDKSVVKDKSVASHSTEDITQEPAKTEKSVKSKKPKKTKDTDKKLGLWDLVYYLVVVILVVIISYLVLILLDRYEKIELPGSLPFVSIAIDYYR